MVMFVDFVSDFRYIPFKISLNMLSKQRKIRFLSPILILQYFHLTFNFALLIEENASASVWLGNSSLDMILLDFLTEVIVLNLLVFKAAHHYTVFIIRNHQRIFSPCFCNSELSALWLFSLILQLSSDVHPNPGPLADQIFSNVSPQSWSQYQISAFWLFALLILLSYDIHPNPGPQHISSEFSNGFLSFCNWNLNTLSINNFSRVSLLEAHNSIFKYDIISLCETSLNEETTVPEGILPGYQYHPLNHPDGRKNGGVGIFYKETLPLRVRTDLSFDECLVCELTFGRKKIFFTVFYRNPEHKAGSVGFEDFLTNFEIMHEKISSENPYATFFTGDINGHSQEWYPEGDTNAEGAKLDELFLKLSLSQIIDEPTHFLSQT